MKAIDVLMIAMSHVLKYMVKSMFFQLKLGSVDPGFPTTTLLPVLSIIHLRLIRQHRLSRTHGIIKATDRTSTKKRRQDQCISNTSGFGSKFQREGGRHLPQTVLAKWCNLQTI